VAFVDLAPPKQKILEPPLVKSQSILAINETAPAADFQ